MYSKPPMRGLWRRWRDVWPLKWRGTAIILAVSLALHYLALPQLDFVVLVSGIGMLVFVAYAVLGVWTGWFWLRWRTQRREKNTPSLRVSTEQWVDTGYDIPRLRWWPFLRVRCDWEGDFGRVTGIAQRSRVKERVCFRQRGEWQDIQRRLVVEDRLGIARVTLRHTAPVDFNVSPHPGALDAWTLHASQHGGDAYSHPLGQEEGDRIELRRYVPGDAARLINWKVYGRTGKLIVRTPERALCDERRRAAYLISAPNEEPVAAAAYIAVNHRLWSDEWLFGTSLAPEGVSDVSLAQSLVRRSGYQVEQERGAELSRYLGVLQRQGINVLTLFVPATTGAWLSTCMAALANYRGSVHIVMAIDESPSTFALQGSANLWRRWFWQQPKDSGARRADAAGTARTFANKGFQVVLFDRRTGQTLPWRSYEPSSV